MTYCVQRSSYLRNYKDWNVTISRRYLASFKKPDYSCTVILLVLSVRPAVTLQHSLEELRNYSSQTIKRHQLPTLGWLKILYLTGCSAISYYTESSSIFLSNTPDKAWPSLLVLVPLFGLIACPFNCISLILKYQPLLKSPLFKVSNNAIRQLIRVVVSTSESSSKTRTPNTRLYLICTRVQQHPPFYK